MRLLLLAAVLASGCTQRPTRTEQDVLRAVETVMRDVRDAAPSVRCERSRQGASTSHSCYRQFDREGRNFTAVSIQVRPAQKSGGVGDDEFAGSLAGPGGSTNRTVGRTRDGAFDVIGTEMMSLKRGTEPLPSASGLVRRVLAIYDAPA